MDSMILGTTTVNADASDLNKLADITVSADKTMIIDNQVEETKSSDISRDKISKRY